MKYDITYASQLAVEQEKQELLSTGERSKELEEAQLLVEQLQNELKVRMKLNQLQSTKVCRLEIRKVLSHPIMFFSADTRDVEIDISSRTRKKQLWGRNRSTKINSHSSSSIAHALSHTPRLLRDDVRVY